MTTDQTDHRAEADRLSVSYPFDATEHLLAALHDGQQEQTALLRDLPYAIVKAADEYAARAEGLLDGGLTGSSWPAELTCDCGRALPCRHCEEGVERPEVVPRNRQSALAAAAALGAAAHEVDDDESAQTLAQMADQWRAEADEYPEPASETVTLPLDGGPTWSEWRDIVESVLAEYLVPLTKTHRDMIGNALADALEAANTLPASPVRPSDATEGNSGTEGHAGGERGSGGDSLDVTQAPRLAIEGDWLIRYVDEHTCGTGKDGHYGAHEPGCGSVPELNLATVEGWARPPTSDEVVVKRADLQLGLRCLGSIRTEDEGVAVDRLRAALDGEQS